MQRGKYKALLLFLTPALLLYTLLVAWPNLSALYVSLLEWDGYTGESTYVGLRNFTRLLTAPAPGGSTGATPGATPGTTPGAGAGVGVAIWVGLSIGLLAGTIATHLRARFAKRPAGPVGRVLPGAMLGALGVSVAFLLWQLASEGRGDPNLWIALNNNLFLTIVPGVCVLVLALFIAHLTNLSLPGMGLMRATYFFPNLMSGLVVGVLWSYLYHPKFGLAGPLLRGLASVLDFCRLDTAAESVAKVAANGALAQSTFIYALAPMMIWAMTGFYVVLLSAAMKNIPTGLYEAARIDGASESQLFFSITLPLIRETLLVAGIFVVISGMRVFEQIWVLSFQYVANDNEVIATYMYQKAFVDGEFGYGSAVAVVLFGIVFGIAIVMRGVLRREVDEF